MAVGEYIGNGNPDGTSLGSSTSEKISFYGVTPIAQRSGATQAVFSTTMTQSTGWGFLSSTAADAAVALILEMRLALIAIGIIKGSA
jgi:hypothetical protein